MVATKPLQVFTMSPSIQSRQFCTGKQMCIFRLLRGYLKPPWSTRHYSNKPKSSEFWMKSHKHNWTECFSKVSQWLYLYLTFFTPWCSHTQQSLKNETWELLQSSSFHPSPCFKVTVTPVLSSSHPQPVIYINLSLHSDWQFTSLLLYTSSSPIPQLSVGRWLHIITSASLCFTSSSLHLSATSLSPHHTL